MPVSSEGAPASEGAPVVQPFPWLGAPFPSPGMAQALEVSCTCDSPHCTDKVFQQPHDCPLLAQPALQQEARCWVLPSGLCTDEVAPDALLYENRYLGLLLHEGLHFCLF